MPMRSRAWRGCLALLATTACAGLNDLAHSLGELQDLQKGLIREFHEPKTGVNITNRQLTVLFVNSEIAGLPEAERAALAGRVAGYVRDHFSGYARLSVVAVGFQSTVSIGVVNSSRTTVPYRFPTPELGPPPPPAPDSTPVDTSRQAAS